MSWLVSANGLLRNRLTTVPPRPHSGKPACGFQQGRQPARSRLAVVVDEGHQRAPGRLGAGVARGGGPLPLLAEDAHRRRRASLEVNLHRDGTAVVDHDHLELLALGQLLGVQRADHARRRAWTAMSGHDDRNRQGGSHPFEGTPSRGDMKRPRSCLDGTEALRLAALAEGVAHTLTHRIHTQQGEDDQAQATPRPFVARRAGDDAACAMCARRAARPIPLNTMPCATMASDGRGWPRRCGRCRT